MIRVLVISDSHGNQQLLRTVLQNENNVDKIIHLGDYYSDLENNEDLTQNKEIIRVPGITNPGYFNGLFPPVQVVEIYCWVLGCVHSLHDSPQILTDIDILLYGHTHKPQITKKFDKIEVNPGHLKAFEDRGNNASYAVLEITEDKLTINIFDYLCNPLQKYSLKKRR